MNNAKLALCGPQRMKKHGRPLAPFSPLSGAPHLTRRTFRLDSMLFDCEPLVCVFVLWRLAKIGGTGPSCLGVGRIVPTAPLAFIYGSATEPTALAGYPCATKSLIHGWPRKGPPVRHTHLFELQLINFSQPNGTTLVRGSFGFGCRS
jgi:hypothetical protein